MKEIIRIRTKTGKYYRGGKEYHEAGELCLACLSTDRIKEKGKLVLRKNRTNGNSFLGCSRYPECKCSYPIVDPEEVVANPNCELCNGSGISAEESSITDESSPCSCLHRVRIFTPEE